MADHYVSVVDVNDANDLTNLYSLATGTSSTSANAIELRVKDGAGLSRKDVLQALVNFELFIENQQLSSAFDLNP